jgi:lipopolysaccharide transport system ATP-binding protein
MTKDIVIRAEGLGKKYVIGHEAEREQYTALRDVIARNVKNFAYSGASLFRKREKPAVPETEDFWALKDVNFEIRRGEVLGIIGRNGAGKSTLLKILSRITEPSEGRVWIKGRVASLLEVGTGFHPELTGRENIYLNGAILGMSRVEIRRKFDEIVAFADVARFLDTPVKRYSSGMYVRLAFAVAAHLEPEILVVDEVLAVGDAEFQQKCLGKLGEVASGGRTVLFVSHNMAAVQNLCTRALLIDSGRLTMNAEPASAISAHLSTKADESPELITRPRPKWARPWIRRVRLVDDQGSERSTFHLGENINVEMDFTAPDDRAIRSPGMSIVVNHVSRGAVGCINTRMSGYWPKSDGCVHGTYSGRILNPNLVQGLYSLDVWFADGAVDVDVVHDACRLSIQNKDIYGSGHAPYDDVGTVFMHCRWSFSDAEERPLATGRQTSIADPVSK